MIPEFEEDGYLPEGIHEATWQEVEDRFGNTHYRWKMLQGLKEALKALKECGCKTLYLDGSFISCVEKPGDYDACYKIEEMDLNKLQWRYPIFSQSSDKQKNIYKGEFKISSGIAKIGQEGKKITYLEFFQRIKNTDDPKGIIRINLDDYDKEFKRIE